jgi:hypothetical protein
MWISQKVVWIRYALDDIEGIEADDWDDEMDSDYTMSEDDDVIGDHQSALILLTNRPSLVNLTHF